MSILPPKILSPSKRKGRPRCAGACLGEAVGSNPIEAAASIALRKMDCFCSNRINSCIRAGTGINRIAIDTPRLLSCIGSSFHSTEKNSIRKQPSLTDAVFHAQAVLAQSVFLEISGFFRAYRLLLFFSALCQKTPNHRGDSPDQKGQKPAKQK